MIYAELYGQEGEPNIKDRGVFLSLQEFIPYRKEGWSSTEEINRMADRSLTLTERLHNKWMKHNTRYGVMCYEEATHFIRQVLTDEIERILKPLDTDSARIARLIALQEESR